MYTDRYMSYKGHILVSYKGQVMGYDTYQEIKENEEKEESDIDEEKITITLTDKQFSMISDCIEHISAYEREFDEEGEQTLKEVADIFGAEYNEI